ncbi:MAG: 3-phosphoshikimate 1-carboxyvinyltransferase, partial [Gammaproteobacteria bacterium]|nr:3-phosphoshikimate 1-carboxyvinyltransferase [Gammaproteobacteria bacterium]
EISFVGDPRAYERPVAPVIKALEELGVQINHAGRYSLPLTISAHGVMKGGELTNYRSSIQKRL